MSTIYGIVAAVYSKHLFAFEKVGRIEKADASAGNRGTGERVTAVLGAADDVENRLHVPMPPRNEVTK